MSQPKDHRIIIKDEPLLKALQEAANRMYAGVCTTYGPKGKNVYIEKTYGRPILTRDGVSVAKELYFKERDINVFAEGIKNASETTNRIAGDATTATVAVAKHLVDEGIKQIYAGVHPMTVSRTLRNDVDVLTAAIKDQAKPLADGQLVQVATVSSGDPLLGELIAGAVEYVGADGGILVEKAMTSEVEREYVDGYYLQSGFTALQANRKELSDALAVVSSKRISSGSEAVQLIDGALRAINHPQGQVPRLVLIGAFEDAAYQTVLDNMVRGIIDAIVVRTPPQFGDMSQHLLEDIAIYCGSKPITETTNLRQITAEHVGAVERVVATRDDMTIFGVSNETGDLIHEENIKSRIDDLKSQLEKEVSETLIEKFHDRISKLEGHVCLFKIGAPSETTKEELEYRVDDAIRASRSAVKEGVLPGGGITLLNLSKLDVSSMFKNALQSTFMQLLINANLPAELKLHEALNAKEGYGFNLREDDPKLTDMVEAGILDPALVVSQAVINAADFAANALSAGAVITFEDDNVVVK